MPSAEALRRLGYHPVLGERQKHIYETNRQLFISVYDYVETLGEPSREKTLALNALQDALMWTNAHVACNEIGGE